MKENLDKIKDLIQFQKALKDRILEVAEDIRSYYKHQNSYTDSLSEDLIVNIANEYDLNEALEYIDDLIEYEEKDNV